MILALLGIVPWLLLGFFMAFAIREPRSLPPAPGPSTGAPGPSPVPSSLAIADEAAGAHDSAPLVSIIVPARNEARNIGRCLETLGRLDYPAFEVVVVDDRSDDDTATLARQVGAGNAQAIRVVEGEPLPEGWFGKPWACRQGAEVARGDFLLFTDADTTHEPSLLSRAMEALHQDGARVLSLLGNQEMETFPEKLVQPQIFALIGLRFRRLDRVLTREGWKDAIANGQYVLVEASAYASIGGHEAVRGEVVEDLRLAQELVRAGHPLTVRLARDAFATRMYTSLGEVVDGWTKNVAVGARQASGPFRGVILPAILLFVTVAWLLPPTVLLGVGAVAAIGGTPGVPTSLLLWAGVATFCTVAIWAGVYRQFGASPAFALIHPLGGVIVLLIVARSWVRGEGRIEWKGRRYSAGEVVGGGSG
jgi:chlorobactene glucosyltransferase